MLARLQFIATAIFTLMALVAAITIGTFHVANLAVVVVVFAMLLSAPFSQRARCALAYAGVPILWAFALHRVAGEYDLAKELTFYASYHADWRNQIVHVLFVPLLIATALVFIAYAPPLLSARPLGLPLNWATLAAAAWSTHFINAAPLVGSFTAALTFGMALCATALVDRELAKAGPKGVPSAPFGRAALWAGGLHVLGWYMQLHPGHAVFEGRKPALLEGLVQAFMDAPLFVWMEVAFQCGHDPALFAQLNHRVAAQHQAWA